MNPQPALISIAVTLMIYMATGIGMLAICDDDMDLGPVARFLLTPFMVIVLPAVDFAIWLMDG